VTIEEESQVLNEARGGVGKSCAYGLIYVNQRIADEIAKTPLLKYSEKFISVINQAFIRRV